MASNRINMVDGDFNPNNFEFRQSEEFNQLRNDWPQVEAMGLDRENDRGHFDPYYDQSLEITDEKERLSFLLLKMYHSKYPNLINAYPTIENYLKIAMQKTQFLRPHAENEQLTADVVYDELINFDREVAAFRRYLAPADFAVLCIENPPALGNIDFWERSPRTLDRVNHYNGVQLSFSRNIVCRVTRDMRVHQYTHIELPESLGNFIVSILPGKRLTQEINGWILLTPYFLSASARTAQISIGLEPEENPKPIISLKLCLIQNLKIFLCDNDDLDIRTFADQVYTWYQYV